MARHVELGRAGEAAAAAAYERRGAVVLDRNWRCADGEIDLILYEQGAVVVCEVKTRSSDRFGSPAEAVGTLKQRRLRRLAVQWMVARQCRGVSIRFDVAEVRPDGHGYRVDIVEGAF